MIDSALIDALSGETVDLFAGAGGWEIGGELLGLEHVVGIELDPFANATRRAAGLSTIAADIAAIDPLDFVGITGLIASPPCQAWSRAGKRLGLIDQEHVIAAAQALLLGQDIRARLLPRLKDPRSLLVIEPLRWALELRPTWIAFEQVPDVLPLWDMFAGALRSIGYSAWTGKLNAADYGVPQTRERAILLASCQRRVDRPRQTHADPRPGLPLHVLPWVSMAQALGWRGDDVVEIDGQRYRARETVSEKVRSWKRHGADVVFRNGNQKNATVRSLDEPASTIAFGHNVSGGVRWEVRTRQGKGEWEQTRSSDEPAPTVVGSRRDWMRAPVERVEMRRGGTRINEGVDPNDEPAPTVTSRVNRWQGHTADWTVDRPATTVQGDPRIAQPGGKKNDANPDSPGRMEDAIRVSLDEAAILQSFPPGYPWQGPKTKRYLQIGNAIPPLLAAHCLAEVLGL